MIDAYTKFRYHRVTEVSCLIQDLEKLPHKDLTLIGEKGVNLRLESER